MIKQSGAHPSFGDPQLLTITATWALMRIYDKPPAREPHLVWTAHQIPWLGLFLGWENSHAFGFSGQNPHRGGARILVVFMIVGDNLCEAYYIKLATVRGLCSRLKGVPGDLTATAIRVKNCIIFPYGWFCKKCYNYCFQDWHKSTIKLCQTELRT